MRPYEGGESEGAQRAPRAEDDLEHALLEWDTLDESELARLRAEPRQAARLELLKEAEAWLTGSGALEPCPEPEELFDYVPGPGAPPQQPAVRQRVRAHLERCGVCRGLVEGLVHAPPPPIAYDPHLPTASPHPLRRVGGDPSLADLRPRRSSSAPRFWRPLASAAAVLLMAWFAFELVSEPAPWTPPGPTLVRGEPKDALLSPLGPVLAPDGEGAFADRPLFELAPQDGAEAYRIVVRRTDGSAFDVGEVVAELHSIAPRLTAEAALAPGHYSWEAFVTIDGLDKPLGQREFRIVEDPDLVERLRETEGIQRVRLLHEAGYESDARHHARDFPSSPEMRSYLDRPLDR